MSGLGKDKDYLGAGNHTYVSTDDSIWNIYQISTFNDAYLVSIGVLECMFKIIICFYSIVT